MNKFDLKENLFRGKTYSIRLQIPDRPIRFHDAIRGDLEFAPETISDPVLVRSAQGGTAGASPGVPVYNYVVTIDDALMGITHVIRGDDHIANTPKQVAIYEALGWKVPEFVHLPTIIGPDRERLSKRHGATTMSGFREMGYLPEALVNHLALLGWAPKEAKSEILSPDQVVAAFSVDDLSPAPAIFDFEKLNTLNRHYLKLATPARLAALCWDYFGGLLPEKEETPDAVLVWFFHMIAMFLPSVNRLGEIPAKAAFIFHMNANLARADSANAAILASDSARRVLSELSTRIRTKPGPLTAADFNAWMNEISSAAGISGNELYDPVRIALTGSTSGPDFNMLIPVLDQGASLNIGISSVGQRIAAFP
jgi:nondiscriminating glutamyl-tRNA synthetase